VAGAEGNQAFAFDLTTAPASFALILRREFFPMRRFSGKALVAAGGTVYYDFGERWIALGAHPNPSFERRATLVLPGGAAAAFDGKEVRCVWHRLLIDGCI